jgi:hypothetical protein
VTTWVVVQPTRMIGTTAVRKKLCRIVGFIISYS